MSDNFKRVLHNRNCNCGNSVQKKYSKKIKVVRASRPKIKNFKLFL